MTKFDPHLFFNPVWEKNFDPPTSSLDPPPTKNLDPPTSKFDNSITGPTGWNSFKRLMALIVCPAVALYDPWLVEACRRWILVLIHVLRLPVVTSNTFCTLLYNYMNLD